MDLFVVPTIGFRPLYGFVIVRIDRRDLVWISVTTNPEGGVDRTPDHRGLSLDGAARYMIRDRDRIYGVVVTRRLRATGIQDKPISPWQNGVCRTADRIDPARVFGPHHCLGRGTSARDSSFLCRLTTTPSERISLAQGCVDFSPGSANRCNQFTHPRRTLSSLRPR